MLSENDKQQIRELLEISFEDIQVFNLEYIYQKIENVFNKEIFNDYVNFLKENPEIDDIENEVFVDLEFEILTNLAGTLFINHLSEEKIGEIIEYFRYWIIHREENQGILS